MKTIRVESLAIVVGLALGAVSLAMADQGSDSPPPTGNASQNAGGLALQEIVVTAAKREEKLLDVPATVVAISGDDLRSLQVNSLVDLQNYVPGLLVQSGGYPGSRSISMRGMLDALGLGGPLVATYIDDVPFGSSTGTARGSSIGLDLLPYDIERIEALEGPQGTLYGSNTMGGLIKYVTVKPDLTTFHVLSGADIAHVNDSGGVDSQVRSAVNLPLITDQLALRLSGAYRDAAGYIDNIGTGVKDSNNLLQRDGRAVLLWKPNDRLSVEVSALVQTESTGGPTAATLKGISLQPLYGPQIINTELAEPDQSSAHNYAITMNLDLDFATLVSASAWSQLNNTTSEDLSAQYGPFCGPGFFGPTYAGCPDYPHGNALALFTLNDRESKFVQELRLTSPDKQQLQWMTGAYFTHEVGNELDSIPTYTPARVELPLRNNLFYTTGTGNGYREIAGFANLTYKFTSRFDATGGVRYSSYAESQGATVDNGILTFGGSNTPGFTSPASNVTTWLGNVRYHLDSDLMLYARAASGYRPGVINGPSPLFTPPPASKADSTISYEGGIKGELFDHRLRFSADYFYVDWKDIQVEATAPADEGGSAYFTNGGGARSEGFEFTGDYLLTSEIQIRATLDHTDAHLIADAPLVGGFTGSQLPGAARWSSSLVLDDHHKLAGGQTLLFGGSYQYRDKFYNYFPDQNNFIPGSNGWPVGPQNLVNVYGGVAFDRLTFRLTGVNIFNNHSYNGIIYPQNPEMPRYPITTPATIRFSVDYRM